MKKACIICLLCSVFMVGGFAQSIEYFSTFDSNEALETSLVPYDVVSIDSSRFVVAANSQDGTKACLLGIDEVGNIQLSATIAEEGHHIHLMKMFLSGDKIVAFAIDKADGDVNSSLMTIHLDTELNIVYQHIEPVVFPNNFINVFSIEKIEETYIAAFITGSFDTEFFTAKIDDDGHITDYVQHDDINTHYVKSIFKVNDADSGMFGICAISNGTEKAACTIYIFDSSLAIVNTKQVPSFELSVPDEVTSCFIAPLTGMNTMLPLPQHDKYLISSLMSVTTIIMGGETIETEHDKCTAIKKFDENFELDTLSMIAIGWRNDTVETTARFRSLDGIYDESSQKTRLYQCTKVDHINYSSQNYPSHIIIVQCDENLNVGWHKRYFNDENGMCYDPSTINATMDGGCLVVGTMHNIDSIDASSIFALKIHDESFFIPETPTTQVTISLFPNPATDVLNIVVQDDNASIQKAEIRNLLGDVVLETSNPQGNSLNVSSLPAGVYIVRIVTNDGKQEFGKMVKR